MNTLKNHKNFKLNLINSLFFKNAKKVTKIPLRFCSTNNQQNNSQNFMNENFPTLPIKDPKKGNMDEVLELGGWHDFLAKKHTDLEKDVFFFNIFGRPAVSIGNPKYLNKMSHLNSRPDHLRGYLRTLVGKKTMNLINTEERKDKNKANLKPAFTREAITKNYGQTLENHMDLMLSKWDKYTEGIPMPLREEISYLIVKNILSVMYGYEATREECLDISDKLCSSILNLEFKSFGREFSPEQVQYLEDEKEYLRNFVFDLIDKWKNIAPEKRSPCYLDVLESEDDKQFAIDNAVTFLVAGVFSTRFLFFTSIYHLSKHSDKQEKLQKEIDKFVKKENHLVKISDLKNLRYLNSCMNETLRITPSATTTARIDEENDLEFEDGLIIPKGTAIILPIAYIFRSEKFWKNSLTFYPERFKEHGMDYSYQFNPFGFAGGRVCIGKQLSEIEAKLLIANFFKNYKSTVPEDQKPPEYTWGSGSNVINEVFINIEKRI